MTEWVVYWLHDAHCIQLQQHGYVGISQGFMTRLAKHQRNPRFPAGFDWSIIFTGTHQDCLALEHMLRPKPGIGWNIARGGKPVIEFTEDVRAKMRKPKRTREQIELSRIAAQQARRDGEWNKKLRAAATGFVRSEASKAKQSAATKGKPKSARHRAAISKASMGRLLSNETKHKISLTQKRRLSPEPERRTRHASFL